MLEKSRKQPIEPCSTTREGLRRWFAMSLLICLICYGSSPLIFAQISGNIQPDAIEIDVNANLFPGGTPIKNLGATIDWVKDSASNTDPASLNNSIATGIQPGVTGAAGGTGHWNGVRIVDGIAGNDQDIFLTGGKENDTTSKYDITQAYLANNQQHIFFGMERRGNNGTTAFDFEFNQLPPNNSNYIPTRTVGDILVTFEMQGSGGSGSATPFLFRWNGSIYEAIAAPAGVYSSINEAPVTPAPWGYVNSQGNWVLSPDIPRFEFAEAQVPLSILPGVNSCGGGAYVQVRTRSSSTPNSDLKDTTKIFEYQFGGPIAGAMLIGRCNLEIGYDGSASRNSSGGTTNLTYSWQFQKNSLDNGAGTWSNVGTASNVSGTFVAPSAGRYRAILTITEGGNCTDPVETNEVNVFSNVSGTAAITPDCDDTFGYSATGSGGNGNYSFEWTIYKIVSGVPVVAKTFTDTGTSSGTLDVDNFNSGANGDGAYSAVVTIKDGQLCSFTPTAQQFEIRHALTASASKTGAAVASNNADSGFTATLTGSTNAPSGDTIGLQWQRNINGTWTDVTNATGTTLSWSMSDLISLGTTESVLTPTLISGDSYIFKRYSLESRVKATRTLNNIQCSAESSGVFVRAIKAIDP
jgi:hypothetical protein